MSECCERTDNTFKDLLLKSRYRNRAVALFGLYIKNGHDVTNRIADQLYAAMKAGTIFEDEIVEVLASDLLWGGEERRNREPVVLVMEASWLAERQDVERAASRSAILRQIGLNTIPVVGGKEWTGEARELAEELHVATTTNGRVDRTSWNNATQNS